MTPSDNYKKILQFCLVVVIVLIVALLTYQVFRSRQFRIVSTDPSTANVATITPFFKINFNKQLSPNNLSLVSNNSLIGSYQIQGKTLAITLNTPMTVGVTYQIRINNISDLAGQKITNTVFAFTEKNIASQDLPKDQQQALLQQQTVHPPSTSNINFTGTDALINNGLSLSQINSLEQAFFEYKSSAKAVAINPSSVEPGPHDPNTSTSFTVNFTVSVDNTPYNATITYSDLDSVRLYLYNSQTNALVFDSGATTPSTNE